VLLVDDDPIMRLLGSRLLGEAGYNVETANDGVEALDRLERRDDVNIVVTDVHMPRMGGVDLLRALRARDGARSALPVIVLTGSGDEAIELRLMAAGADDYIRKPIEPGRFVARVRATLRRANL
jgi:DNA-binding response OmpR family regulator